MADLLTHVLTAYVLAKVLSWRYDWIGPQLITVAMVGAVVPDLNRIELIVPASLVEAALKQPFSWDPIHRIGGAATVILIGTVALANRYRTHVLLVLVLGVVSHFVLDTLTYNGSGLTRPFLWPLTDRGLGVPGFYARVTVGLRRYR